MPDIEVIQNNLQKDRVFLQNHVFHMCFPAEECVFLQKNALSCRKMRSLLAHRRQLPRFRGAKIARVPTQDETARKQPHKVPIEGDVNKVLGSNRERAGKNAKHLKAAVLATFPTSSRLIFMEAHKNRGFTQREAGKKTLLENRAFSGLIGDFQGLTEGLIGTKSHPHLTATGEEQTLASKAPVWPD